MSIILKIICIFAPEFINLLKNFIIMVNKEVLKTLFNLSLDKCINHHLSFDVHSKHVADVISLLLASKATFEITACHIYRGDEYVTFQISGF